jgi:hypothetical protein
VASLGLRGSLRYRPVGVRLIRYSLAIAAQIVEAVTGKTCWDRQGLGECAGRVDVAGAAEAVLAGEWRPVRQ